MCGLIKIIILLYCCAINYSSSYDIQNLKSVAVVFRHGERNIYQSYPNDPWKDASFWEGGMGQLRKEGKVHHYHLGRWFRQRYNGFISDQYKPEELRVQCTGVDRTLMSVSSHLAGLYPPKGVQLWNQLIGWQPIPIHTTPLEEDPILGDGVDCPRYIALFNQMEQSPKVQARWNQTEIDYITQHSGKKIKTFLDTLDIHDTLYVETHFMNFSLPEWTQAVYPEPLNNYSAFAFGMQAYNRELARFKVGPLYHEIIRNFNLTVAKNDTYKYKIYSSHDVNVANILQSFGAYQSVQPPYASLIIFELRQSPQNDYFVNVLYKNTTDPYGEPHKITIKDCEFDCDLNKFTGIVKDLTIDVPTFWKECKNTAGLEDFMGERQFWVKL